MSDEDRDNGHGSVQVAALCWRRAPELEVLLVTTLRTHRWILPKGWPIEGLTPAQAAAREALEEAGVTGEISLESIGSYRYLKEKKSGEHIVCDVNIYPLRVTGQVEDWQEKGARELVWLPVGAAAERVSEDGVAAVLRTFGGRAPA